MSSHRNRQQKDELLERLRARYEAEGYRFVAPPSDADLPPFLGTYIPDAVALKPGANIAIEIRSWQEASPHRLVDLRKIFDGRADWQFNVVLMGRDPLQETSITPVSPALVRPPLDEAKVLAAQGHHRAAFMMSWSLLEATLRALVGKKVDRPRGAGTVIEGLTMEGYLAPETERRLRGLVELRNRTVHGDLNVEPPSAADVAAVLDAVEEALSEAAA